MWYGAGGGGRDRAQSATQAGAMEEGMGAPRAHPWRATYGSCTATEAQPQEERGTSPLRGRPLTRSPFSMGVSGTSPSQLSPGTLS